MLPNNSPTLCEGAETRFGVRQLAAAFLLRACSRSAGPSAALLCTASKLASKLPHSKRGMDTSIRRVRESDGNAKDDLYTA